MDRKELMDDTIKKIKKLPNHKLQEINHFAEFLISKIDDRLIQENLQKLSSDSKAFKIIDDEDDLYTVNDLKERYK
jgi:hypothetical protein